MLVEPQIEIAVDNAISAIKASKVYNEYKQCLEKVKAEPQLKEKIDEFRRRNFQMQNNGDCSIEQIEAFEREYDSFRENPLVSEFLASELAFCRMMQQMLGKLMEEVEFE